MTDEYVKKIVIVGGGTAGWLTAAIIASNYLSDEKNENEIEITLIESRTVPTVGVGEGTWPSMRSTLRSIGIRESELLRLCQATLKQGSRFLRWFDGSSCDSFLHPFDAPPSEDEVDWHSLWKFVSDDTPYASAVSVQNEVCFRNLAPKQKQTPEYAGVTNYSYHLDALSFAELLKQHCLSNHNVFHVFGDVVDFQIDSSGRLLSLETADKENIISGDLFIDCTGKKASLINRFEESSIIDVSDILFNDCAMVLQVPYKSRGCEIVSQTDATAVEAGWIWDIALQNRRGVGYVFSSSHTNEESVYKTLTRYLGCGDDEYSKCIEKARLIRFRSHYRAKPWVRNLLAIGLSQGFVEPLEASAIVMIELAASYIRKILPFSKEGMHLLADQFNQRFEYRWKRIVEFLKLHYVLSKRREVYWVDHREEMTVPENLKILLKKWKYTVPVREDFTDALEIFTAASFAYVLYGMRYETLVHPYVTKRNDPKKLESILNSLSKRREKLITSLPTNRDLLEFLSRTKNVF